MGRAEKVERIYQCKRCHVLFPVIEEPKDLPYVKCPRSCADGVIDITEAKLESLKRSRTERERRMAEREKGYNEVAAKAQEEAIKLAKMRGER